MKWNDSTKTRPLCKSAADFAYRLPHTLIGPTGQGIKEDSWTLKAGVRSAMLKGSRLCFAIDNSMRFGIMSGPPAGTTSSDGVSNSQRQRGNLWRRKQIYLCTSWSEGNASVQGIQSNTKQVCCSAPDLKLHFPVSIQAAEVSSTLL